MILKQERSTIGLAVRHQNFFDLETGLEEKVMLIREREQPI